MWFNFRKLTLQEITLVGTYCYTNKDFKQTINLLHKNTLGPLDWIEYRELKMVQMLLKKFITALVWHQK